MATQQQQAVTAVPTANIQPQSVVVLQTQPFPQTLNQLNYKRTIYGLAISEIILGSISVVLGIVACALLGQYIYFTTGEGIWCGVLIVVAGALGIPSARANSSNCIITCHLAFSIVGAVFAAVLFSLSILAAIISYGGAGIIISSLNALASFSVMILLIISASYCCALTGCCSQGAGASYGIPQGASYGIPQGQVVYAQQPGTIQGIPGSQPGYFVQGYQPVAPPIQNVFPQTNMMQQPFQPPQVVQNPNVQNPEKQQDVLGQAQMQTNAGIPPAYESVPTYNQM